jgi:ureidoglycolate lyase
MHHVTAEPITAEAFAPFGDLLETPGEGRRLDFAAALGNERATARTNLAVVQALPQPLPLTVALMERHPHSSQAFMPLDIDRFLIAVCPDGGGVPDLSGLRAFIASRTQGINYHAGTWHHPMTALGRPATFAMLIWEDGSDGDCTFHHLAATDRLMIDAPS